MYIVPPDATPHCWAPSRFSCAGTKESLQKERDMYQQDVEHLRQSLRERKNAESSPQLEQIVAPFALRSP